LHMNGSPINECIAAYRTAISLTPQDGALKLNLAQLLFIKGIEKEASKLLDESIRSDIDESAQLEVQFYLLSHTSAAAAESIRVTKVLLDRGARLQWDVRQNIEHLRQSDPDKAILLEIIAEIMAGERDAALLDEVLDRWQ